MTLFGKPFLKIPYLASLPGDSTKGDSLIPLIISKKLSGESTNDEAKYDFSMGPKKFQTP
jgi:hypothetical protein